MNPAQGRTRDEFSGGTQWTERTASAAIQRATSGFLRSIGRGVAGTWDDFVKWARRSPEERALVDLAMRNPAVKAAIENQLRGGLR